MYCIQHLEKESKYLKKTKMKIYIIILNVVFFSFIFFLKQDTKKNTDGE